MPQVIRFLVAGVLCVTIDYIVYNILMAFGVGVSTSKAISVTTSVCVSYFINVSWTFNSENRLERIIKYITVYAVSIIMNVFVNMGALSLSGSLRYSTQFAFLCATAASTIFNYLCLKLWVFRSAKAS